MKRLLVDVNVLLDAALVRSPHSESAVKIWAVVEGGRVAGYVPAHGVTTLFYLLARARGAVAARRAIGDLLSVFKVAAVDHAVIQRALTLSWKDFEDAVCAAAAEAAGCDLIVTRDPLGFKGSPVPSVDPATAWALFAPGEGPGRVAEPVHGRYAAKRRPGRRRGARPSNRV